MQNLFPDTPRRKSLRRNLFAGAAVIGLLVASFGAISGLYVQLDAPFMAVIQIIVYAGAIMVLFLFVIMLLNLGQGEPDLRGPGSIAAAVAVVGLLAAELLVLRRYTPDRLASELALAPPCCPMAGPRTS